MFRLQEHPIFRLLRSYLFCLIFYLRIRLKILTLISLIINAYLRIWLSINHLWLPLIAKSFLWVSFYRTLFESLQVGVCGVYLQRLFCVDTEKFEKHLICLWLKPIKLNTFVLFNNFLLEIFWSRWGSQGLVLKELIMISRS